jgi:hypothetical protein
MAFSVFRYFHSIPSFSLTSVFSPSCVFLYPKHRSKSVELFRLWRQKGQKDRKCSFTWYIGLKVLEQFRHCSNSAGTVPALLTMVPGDIPSPGSYIGQKVLELFRL